jgi:hypothetical protein
VALFLLILAAVIIPGQIVSPLARHEANAVEGLHLLGDLELRYAAVHPSQGFTCEFAALKVQVPSDERHIHAGFLSSDSFEGYRFLLSGCEVGANGVVVRYRATAVPLLPGETGVRAFCVDQTRELRYAVDGKAENCRPL